MGPRDTIGNYVKVQHDDKPLCVIRGERVCSSLGLSPEERSRFAAWVFVSGSSSFESWIVVARSSFHNLRELVRRYVMYIFLIRFVCQFSIC
ncbi:Protein of unknown function [Gryllus bimaculatus]|nr:Protein of unknown function [Gryllus bimaculatus]